MIGFYDYTVILTYLSLASAFIGILMTLSGNGMPHIGALFLLLSGCLDAFDGRVARTKKNRTEMEKSFGIQIDSLSDLVAFGVLPACIGAALIKKSKIMQLLIQTKPAYASVLRTVSYVILALYVLAALIRLAYYNITEEERQIKKKSGRKSFIGVPVTTSALIFPVLLLLQSVFSMDLTFWYIGCIAVLGIAFLIRVNVCKPSIKGVLIMIAIGAVEFVLLMIFMRMKKR